jgi:hypothetical protein
MLPAEPLRFTIVFFSFSLKLISPVYVLVYLCAINRDFVNNLIVYNLDRELHRFSVSPLPYISRKVTKNG